MAEIVVTEAHADVATDTLRLISIMILDIERFMAIFNIKPGKQAFSQPNDGAKSYIYEIAAKGYSGAICTNLQNSCRLRSEEIS